MYNNVLNQSCRKIFN